MVAALPVVAAYLQAVSKSAGKLTRAVKEEPPAQAGGFLISIAFGKLGQGSDKPRLREPAKG
jgi:hypothetical protein